MSYGRFGFGIAPSFTAGFDLNQPNQARFQRAYKNRLKPKSEKDVKTLAINAEYSVVAADAIRSVDLWYQTFNHPTA